MLCAQRNLLLLQLQDKETPNNKASNDKIRGLPVPADNNPPTVIRPKSPTFKSYADCALHPWQPDLPEHLRHLASSGTRVIHLSLSLHEYNSSVDPLRKSGYVVQEDFKGGREKGYGVFPWCSAL